MSLHRPLSLDVKPCARNGGCCKSFAIKENSLKHLSVRALVNNKQPNSGNQNQQVLLDQIHRIQTEEPWLSMKIPIQRMFLTFMSLHLSWNKSIVKQKLRFPNVAITRTLSALVTENEKNFNHKLKQKASRFELVYIFEKPPGFIFRRIVEHDESSGTVKRSICSCWFLLCWS